MDFFEVLDRRYSVRSYRNDPVSDELLTKVLEAGRAAPTACNRQPFQIYLLPTQGREAELKRIYRAEWFSQAPYVLGICVLTGQAWSRRDGKNYGEVDATIAMDHLILAATALGLGTCWIAAFDPLAAREVLRLPPGQEPVAFTPLGYAADAQPPRQRKALDSLCKRV